MKRTLIAATDASDFAALLAGCATASAGDEEMKFREPDGECDASSAQSMLGQRATQELGGELLRMTGAETLRWVPPRTAVTMDYRPSRLTVTYDDDYAITKISCG